MSDFIIRACCPAGLERKFGFVDAADGSAQPGQGFGNTTAPGPPVAEINHEVSERTSWHEAAHAVIGHGFGQQIELVSVVPPECVKFATRDTDAWAALLRSLAGPAGEDERAQWFMDEPVDSVRDFVARAYDFQGGGCDGCRAARSCWRILGFAAPQDAAVEMFRAGEHAVRALLRRRDIRAAVARLAERLFIEHQINGDAAHAIIADFLEFGSLKTKEQK